MAVTIDSPLDGAVVAPGPVTLTGSAAVDGGALVADTALVVVLDVSGSTNNASIAGCGGDQNGDGAANRVIDCELAAARSLFTAASGPGTVADVGVVVLADDGAAADLGPDAGEQVVTGETADVDQVLGSVFSQFGGAGGVGQFTPRSVGTGTDFADGLTAVTAVAAASGRPRTIVAFVSDGPANGGDIDDGALAAVPAGVDVHTFALGTLTCANASNGRGSLLAIATATGGTCTRVLSTAMGTLPTVLTSTVSAAIPGLQPARVSALTLSVDGGPAVPVTDVTPALPATGPAAVSWSATVDGLGAGPHELCVTATGSGSVTDCSTVVVNAPPVVDAGGPYIGTEGAAVEVSALVTDPGDPGLTSEWTVTPLTGVDPGATCAFADPAAVGTKVVCTDDGLYTLTVTADDGVTGPVSVSTTLKLDNTAPTVAIASPASGDVFSPGTFTTVSAPISDPGTNDTHTCAVDFGDGTPLAPGTVTGGTCTATHEYYAAGRHEIVVTATDDDGESGTASVTVSSYLPGRAFGFRAEGPVAVESTPQAICPPGGRQARPLLTTPLGTATNLVASCTVQLSGGRTILTAAVQSATLFNGQVVLTDLQSSCQSSEDGITSSSAVGTLNGMRVGSAPSTIVVPGVGEIHFNESTRADGRPAQYAVRIVGPRAQQVILAGCLVG